MIYRMTRLVALAAALAVGVAACDETDPTILDGPDPAGGPATLKILLTDAAADYLAAAWVDIGEVQLLPVDGSPITLTEDGTDGMVNLLELQDGATAQLADAAIEAGEYKQLRLFVEAASVELVDGYTFRDGSSTMELIVPSGAKSGLKLNLWPAETTDGDGMHDDAGVMIVPGETVLVLDFDVNQSFRLQGNPETPAGIKSVHFQPAIRVTARDVAGSISGVVSGAADSIDVAGLTVTAEPTGPATVPGYQTLTATAITDADGAYTIHFLVPGDYEVTVAVPEGYFTDPLAAPITVGHAEDVVGVDFLVDETGSIAGVVTGAADSIDVAGLTVTADDGAGGTLTATTDAEGAYMIDGVLPGDYDVSVTPPAGYFASPVAAAVTVGASEDVVGVDFVLDEAGSIAGTVTPAADSIGVAGLAVTAVNAADAELVVVGETDGAGAYVLADVVPGEYVVTVAVPEGFATTPASASATVGVGEAVTEVDFSVDEAAGGG